MSLNRRDAIALGLAFAGFAGAKAAPLPDGIGLGEPTAFSPRMVIDRARALAAKPYQKPSRVPKEWEELTYDQYRAIWFDTRNAFWNGTDRSARLEFFAPGLYFPTPIEINVVDDARTSSAPILFELDAFDKTDQFPDLPITDAVGYSGFRIHGEMENPGVYQEYAVFQGASYFRAIGTGQIYGLSARGLALNTVGKEREEFPEFRAFWVEAPKKGKKGVVVHALLDSPSVTGAYRFHIEYGDTTTMKIETVIFPRVELKHVGIAPETSMFFFDETNHNRFDDFRPAVHDSDGLLMANGQGEILWRALANPLALQVSSFVDENPVGFGLMQRAQDLRDFADLEAHYHRRPSLWVTPGEDWGKGTVNLVEIPTEREIYDNIVAYWVPETPLQAGSEHEFTYQLDWCAEAPIPRQHARVLNTRMGERWGGGRIATIDFSDHARIPQDLAEIDLHVSTDRGTVSPAILQRNPETGGVRMGFSFDPGDETALELRAQLLHEGETISEVWLYRWTA